MFAVAGSISLACAAGMTIAAGCETTSSLQSSPESLQGGPPRRSDPAGVQTAVMGFADRYLSAMADAYDKAKASNPTPEGALAAQQSKVQAALGALGNAVNPNPLAGLMDMAVLVTLTRGSSEDPWAREAFGPDGLELILAALKAQESDIWRIAASYLTQEQIRELRHLAEQWRQAHPAQRYLAGVRLADFPQADRADSPDFRLAESVFGIIRLDPFTGLDPAVRQVEQSRILAERMFFYMRHMSFLVSWQAEALYMQMLAAPEMKRVLDDTTRFTENTGRFTDATREFADASAHLAETVEKFRAELPEQQASLVKELEGAVARQSEAALKQAGEEIAAQRDAALKQVASELAIEREAALKQAAAEIAAERAAAIEQLNAAVVAQQDLITKNLQSVMDSSIDRLYARARSLVLIAIGGALAAILVCLLIAAPLLRRARAGGSRGV